jgi:hypothetical protein
MKRHKKTQQLAHELFEKSGRVHGREPRASGLKQSVLSVPVKRHHENRPFCGLT